MTYIYIGTTILNCFLIFNHIKVKGAITYLNVFLL